MIQIFYPKSIYTLLNALSKHKVYVAGGFVRDMLLAGRGGEFGFVIPVKGKTLSVSAARELATLDIDLVTPDPLEIFLPTVQTLSKNYHITTQYQAVQFSFEGYQVTLTRLRCDTACDGRQAKVAFVDTLQEDVWRRDFTINALYADEEGQVIDFLGGYQDLAQRKVKFIGDPETRVKEDLLRILRYVRFCSLLKTPMDFQILDMMKPYIPGLKSIPQSRLQCEIKKIQKLPLGKENLIQLDLSS